MSGVPPSGSDPRPGPSLLSSSSLYQPSGPSDVLTEDANRCKGREEAEHFSAERQAELEEAKRGDQERATELMDYFGVNTRIAPGQAAEVQELELTALASASGAPATASHVRPPSTSVPSETAAAGSAPSTKPPSPAAAVAEQEVSAVRFHIGADDEQEYNDQSPGAAFAVAPAAALPQRHSHRLVARRSLKSRVSSNRVELARISDPDIRAYLDPLNESVTSAVVETWPEEKINRLVEEIQPENFPRILQHAEEDGVQARAEPLTFSRVTYTDEQGNVRLQDVSGYFVPGEVVGIISAPDAGASTLLDLLAGRRAGGTLDGEVLYNNKQPGIDYQKSVGYIDQNDLHSPLLSVEETLYFSARLRLPASIPDKLVRFRVRTVMALLGLTHVANSFVGDDMTKGISGGQKRRLSVGVELTAGHSVLLADCKAAINQLICTES
jgi:ABC-type uncharacterized transport system YnjBCD ATPase subunit